MFQNKGKDTIGQTQILLRGLIQAESEHPRSALETGYPSGGCPGNGTNDDVPDIQGIQRTGNIERNGIFYRWSPLHDRVYDLIRDTRSCDQGNPLILRHPGDLHEHLYRIEGVAPYGGFFREHDRIGPIQDGIGNIRDLGPGRPGIPGHGLQHLGCRNNRFCCTIRLQDELFLGDGHLLYGDLDPQVSAGNHETVGCIDDRIYLLKGFLAFYLCHHKGLFPECPGKFLYLHDIFRALCKRYTEEIDTGFQAEFHKFQVFFSNWIHGKPGIGEVHPFVGEELTAGNDPAGCIAALYIEHLQVDKAVIEKYPASLFYTPDKVGKLYRDDGS